MIKRGVLLFFVFIFLINCVTAFDSYEIDDYMNVSNYIDVNGAWQYHDFNSSLSFEDNDYIKFNASLGKEYIIETSALESYDEADTYIFLYYENGTLIDSNDDIEPGLIRDSRLTFNPTKNGTYYVRIKEFYGKVGGEYKVRIHEQFGILIPFLVQPSAGINISQGSLFNVSLGFQCVNGVCKDVDAYLDPQEVESKIEHKVYEMLSMNNEVEVIVKLSEETSLKNFELEYDLESVNIVTGLIDEKGLEELKQSDKVEKVFYNREINLFLDQSVPFINADDVWSLDNLSITGEGYSVCILDTGINYSHSAFGSCNPTNNISDGSCAKVIAGYDFVNNDADPIADHQHGTHIAGIIASNDATNKGVAPGANIVAVKVLDAQGSGDLATLLAGMDWCISRADLYNISVLSLSLGDSQQLFSEPCNLMPESATINEAIAKGILVTIASGNEGQALKIAAPGCVENATSVGSVSLSDTFSSFSDRANYLDILAPGEEINAPFGSGFASLSGTSMATPHVAAAAILVKQWFEQKYNRFLSPMELNHILKYSGKTLTDSTGINYKRLDLLSAIEAKGIIPVEYAEPFYTFSPNPSNVSCLKFLEENSTCNQTWTINATGDEGTWEFFGIYEMENVWFKSPKFNVTIYIEEINSSPEANPGPMFLQNISDIEFEEDGYYLLNLTNHFNDSEALTFRLNNITGIYFNQSGWLINFITEENYNGINSAWITAIDSFDQNITSNNFSINITPVNDAPVLDTINNVSINITELVSIQPVASDVDNNNLTFNFSLPLNSSGYWQTNSSDAGNYSINISVSDGELQDSQIVYIFVSSNTTFIEEPVTSSDSNSDEEGTTTGGGGGGGYIPKVTENVDIDDADDDENNEEIMTNSVDNIQEEKDNATISIEASSTPTGFFSKNYFNIKNFVGNHKLYSILGSILAILILVSIIATPIILRKININLK